jgi:hypothetical protein
MHPVAQERHEACDPGRILGRDGLDERHKPLVTIPGGLVERGLPGHVRQGEQEQL